MLEMDEEIQDLTTCGVCLEEFDVQLRKPKCLPCSHTLCLRCLQMLCSDRELVCPMCRHLALVPNGGPDRIPNCSRTLYLISLADRFKTREKAAKRWCLDCGCQADIGCSSVHLTVTMGTTSTAEAESLQKLRGELLLKLPLVVNWSKAQISHFTRVLKSVETLVRDELKSAIEECTIRLDFLISKLEAINSNHETFSSLKKEIDAVMVEMGDDLSKYNVEHHDEINRSTAKLQQEVTRILTPDNFSQQRNELLRYLVSCLCPEGVNYNQTIAESESTVSAGRDEMDRAPSFRLNASVFILEFSKRNSVIGELHIRPCTSHNQQFLQLLGEFTWGKPAVFMNREISNVRQNIRVLLPLENAGFRPPIPAGLWSAAAPAASSECDVVMTNVVVEDGRFRSFDLVVLIDSFRSHYYLDQSPFYPFGRISRGRGLARFLSGCQSYAPAKIRMKITAV